MKYADLRKHLATVMSATLTAGVTPQFAQSQPVVAQSMESTAQESPSPAALALLNQSNVPNVKGYLHGVVARDFPDSNVALITQGDDTRAEFQGALDRAIVRRPAVQERIAGDSRLQRTLNDYTNKTVGTVVAQREADGFNKPEGNASGLAGKYYFETDTPSVVQKLGLNVMMISLDGSSGCRGCKTQDQPVACAEAVTPDQLQTQGREAVVRSSLFKDNTSKVLSSVSTAFHEFGHGLHLQGRSSLGINLESRFSNADFGNKIENVAQSFSTLMMIREFGALGRNHMQRYLDPTDVPNDGAHFNRGAIRETFTWADKNSQELKTMKPEQVFQQAKKIGESNALTKDQAADIDQFVGSIYDSRKNPAYVTDVVQRYRDEAATTPFSTAENNAQTRIELGRLGATGQLSCAAPSQEVKEQKKGQAADSAAKPRKATTGFGDMF
jgi:hypothetical protein